MDFSKLNKGRKLPARDIDRSTQDFQRTGESKYKKQKDYGKLSFWKVDDDYPSPTCVATGTLQIVDDAGNVVESLRCFLHVNKNKRHQNSPDYYGFVKVDDPFIEEPRHRSPAELPQVKVNKQFAPQDTEEGEADDGDDGIPLF